jgi:hypothetical protein
MSRARIYRNNGCGRVRITPAQEEVFELMRNVEWIEVRMLDVDSGRIQVWGWDAKPWAEGPSRMSGLMEPEALTLDADGKFIGRTTYKTGRVLGITRDEVDYLNEGAAERWADWIGRK